MAKKILINERLFHSVHGLCRVAAITPMASPAEASYSLLPISQTRSKARFTIPRNLLEKSGFKRVVSAREAAAILEYFKTGKKKKSTQGNAWDLAITLKTQSQSKEISKDKRKIQQLGILVKNLANELAIVLEVTGREAIEKIQESLVPASKINPQVLTIIENVDFT